MAFYKIYGEYYMVNSVDGNYLAANTGINQRTLQNTIEKSKDTAVDNFTNNTVVKSSINGVSDESNKKDVVLALPFVYYLNKFTDNLIAGKGENSGLLKRASQIGDKISNIFHLDKIFSDENTGKISKKLKENRFTKYFTEDFAAVPKSMFAKSESMASSYTESILKEPAEKVLSNLASNIYTDKSISSKMSNLSADTIKLLKGIGPDLTDDYLSKVSSSITELASKNISEADKKALEMLGNSVSEYIAGGKMPELSAKLYSGISSVLGRFKDNELMQNLSDETSGFISELNKKYSAKQIINAADDLVNQGVNIKGYLKISELRNKIKTANNQMGETLTGKLFSKGLLKIKDTLTFNGGDILSLFYTASALVQASKAAKEAPKGEKKSTFMHVLSENYIGFILLKPSSKMLYSIAGNKYRGMDKAGRDALKELITSANKNPNLTREGLKLANLQKKLLLKGVEPSKVAGIADMGLKEAKKEARKLAKQGAKIKLPEKLLKLFGGILGTGLDDIKRHKVVNLPILGEKMLPHPTLKGFLGGFSRAVIIMMVIQPLLQKPVTKLIHKIFGEPKTYLEKEKQKEQTAETSASETVQNPDAPDAKQDTNLINKYINNDKADNTSLSAQTPIQTQTSDNADNALPASGIKDESSENRYIPSIQVDYAYDVQKEKELGKYTDNILKKSDKFIKNINKSLD